jgi:hypothetical protein
MGTEFEVVVEVVGGGSSHGGADDETHGEE